MIGLYKFRAHLAARPAMQRGEAGACRKDLLMTRLAGARPDWGSVGISAINIREGFGGCRAALSHGDVSTFEVRVSVIQGFH